MKNNKIIPNGTYVEIIKNRVHGGNKYQFSDRALREWDSNDVLLCRIIDYEKADDEILYHLEEMPNKNKVVLYSHRFTIIGANKSKKRKLHQHPLTTIFV